MKTIFSILFSMLLFLITTSISAQITGGNDNTPDAESINATSTGKDALSSTVNLMSGTLNASYSLGSVSTPTGLTYTQTLSYNSTYVTGDNTPFISGIPYGEGWNLNIPSITVKTASKHKYTQLEYLEYERDVQNDPTQEITFNPATGEDINEGKIEYFFPEINIPGVASGRLVFKGYIYNRDPKSTKEAVFVLHDFSSIYIEVILREDNSWRAVLPNGSVYVFDERKQVVINPSNQRFQEEANVEAIFNARETKKITTTWYVSYIENPSQNQNYKITFNYKKLGKFDFHQEQIFFYDGSGSTNKYGFEVSNTAVYRDIFLENVSAVYTDENKVIPENDPNGTPAYAIIEFEKLDFLYQEDQTIRKPYGMTELPGILLTGVDGVTAHDELYNKIVVYNAKSQNSQFINWRKYEHIKRDQNSLQSFASKTNPYLSTNGYRRKEEAATGLIPFDHSFLESPQVQIQTTNGVSNMPPGDLYEIETVISANSNYYCNFDINIVTGNTGDDANPTLSTSTISNYSNGDYSRARHTTVFSTFMNQSKWNTYHSSSNIMNTKNFFVMPNLPNSFDGFFIQIGPGNSDNIFDVHEVDPNNTGVVVFQTPFGHRTVLDNTYTQERYDAEGGSQYWYNRQTAKIPHNFGIGLPWYSEYLHLKTTYQRTTPYLQYFPVSGHTDKIHNIYTNWWKIPGSTPNIGVPEHQPTLTNQESGLFNPGLFDVKIHRYSKKPYVLKAVKHYKLKGDGVGTMKGEMFQDNIIEFEYAYVQAAAYQNIVENSAQQSTPTATEISKRYIITLVQIENSSSSTSDKRTAVNFDYQLTPPLNKSETIQDYNDTYYEYTSVGENVVLTRITDPLGKQSFISYYSLDESATTAIRLVDNQYRYYTDPKKPWDPGSQTSNITTYLAPSHATQYNRAVKEIKNEIANEPSIEKRLNVQTYSYSNFKAYKEPEIPLHSESDSKLYYYLAHQKGNELHGFTNTTTTYKSSVGGSVEKTEVTEHHFEHHLWGKTKKVSTYSGATISTRYLLSEDIYTYDVVEAFENGLKRPSYAGLHLDYHDYLEADNIPLPGMTSYSPGYITDFNISADEIDDINIRKDKLSLKEEIIPVSGGLKERNIKVNYLLTESNISSVPVANDVFLNSYFVKLTKLESKLYDLASTKNTTTVTEYDYFDANYKGESTSKGYDYILKSVSSALNPHRLWFIPSWNIYSTTTYNLETPDKKSVKENFYYYDLKNEYGAFKSGFENIPPFTDLSQTWGSNNLLSKGVMNFTPNGLAALSHSNYFGIRNILMEERVRGEKTNYPNHIHSTYYLYDIVADAADYTLKSSPFTTSNATETIVSGGPFYPTSPKPGVVTTNNSGNDYVPNHWGSTDPVEMGPPPIVDPTIVVLYYVKGGWLQPVNPEKSHDRVINIYGESNTSAGKKIHTYLTALNLQISTSLDEYLRITNPQNIIIGLIPNYNDNNAQHNILGNFMLRGVHMINNQLNAGDVPIPLGTYLDSVDSDSMDVIVYSPTFELSNESSLETGYTYQTNKDIYVDALRLSKVITQIDDVVLDEFDSKNTGYDYTNLPPILQFDFNEDINATPSYTFTPLFPYKTLTTRKINKLNYLGGIEEEEDVNGLVTKNELFVQHLIYVRENTGSIPSPDNRKILRINVITEPFGAIKTTTVGLGESYPQITSYTYYNHGLVRTLAHPNGNTEEFQYDELLRPYKTIKDGKLLAINKYSSFPTHSLYASPDMLSDRSNNYALTNVSFENRALVNYKETHLVFENAATQKGVISRSFIDPLGRAYQTVTQKVVDISSNPQVYDTYTYHTGKIEYDSRNLPYRNFKTFEINTGVTSSGLTILSNPVLSPLYQEILYENTVQARPTESIDFGGTTSHSSKKEYIWLDKTGIETELGLSLAEKALLMPLYTTKSYIYFKTKNIDQDGKEVITYTDPLGEKIATKSFSDAGKTLPIITLYFTNAQGLVQKVINPKKQESIYQYNILGWQIEENTPDKGLTRFIFNKAGQVTLMQDENARNGINNEVNAVNTPYYIQGEFDKFGRLTKTSRINVDYSALGITNCGGVNGICALLSPLGLSSYSPLTTYNDPTENVCYSETFSNSKTYDWEFSTKSYLYGNCDNLNMELTLSNFKDLTTTNIKPIKENYYDAKPSLANQHSQVLSTLDYTLGRLTAAVSYNQSGQPIQHKYYSYLADGKIVKEQHQFNEAGIDVGATGIITQIDYGYTYTEKLQHKNVWLNNAGTLTFKKQYHYEYDDFDRLKEIYFNNGTLGNLGTKIATYTYNNVLGIVEKVNYFGFNDVGCKDLAVDEITYDRTTDDRNRLTKITSKFFDWEMYYDANIPIATNTGLATGDVPTNNSTNYNGNTNFTLARYRLNTSSFSSNPPTIGNPVVGNLFKGVTVYSYQYDGLNRLTKADATIEDHILQGLNHPNCLVYGDVNYLYDEIGNFTQIKRYNNVSDPTTIPTLSFFDMNNFTYASGKNILTGITEVNGNRNTTFSYDNNGNVTDDTYRGIYNTKYNERNLPYELSPSGKTVNYLYDENNFRLYKEVVNGGSTTKEYYVKDATGEIVVILDLQNTQVQQWNIADVAKAKPVVDGQDLFFYIKDHLGNTRLTYKPTICQTCSTSCVIIDYQFEHAVDYYPFGKILREYNPTPYGKEKFLTTGNERDAETDWDYRNARYYDAEIGRFLAVDPLANKLPLWSPYIGLNDNPIYFIDPTGLQGEDWVKDAQGNIKWDKDANSKETTKKGETYLGTTLTFEFKSYIDGKLWDGPGGNLAAGVKLTTHVYVEGQENSKGELVGISSRYKITLGNTPVGKPRLYYPGLGNGQNKFQYKTTNTDNGFTYSLLFEQHASVSKAEEFALNALAFDIVNVAQQLKIDYSNNILKYSSATDVFPSATLSLNGSQVMYYPQPSFVETHKFQKTWINDYFYYYWNDYKYKEAKFYKR